MDIEIADYLRSVFTVDAIVVYLAIAFGIVFLRFAGAFVLEVADCLETAGRNLVARARSRR